MSDSTAFLGGAAFAGLAALLLLRGGGGIGPSNVSAPQSFSTVPIAPPQIPIPPPLPSDDGFDQQRRETEQLKTQFERQRAETEQLKAQLQSQQLVIDALTSQIEQSNVSSQVRPGRELDLTERSTNPLLSSILWALAGMVLTITGGALLVLMLALLSRQQRPSRTVVIHSMDENPAPYLYPKRRSEFLPPRLEHRRVDPTTYDN